MSAFAPRVPVDETDHPHGDATVVRAQHVVTIDNVVHPIIPLCGSAAVDFELRATDARLDSDALSPGQQLWPQRLRVPVRLRARGPRGSWWASRLDHLPVFRLDALDVITALDPWHVQHGLETPVYIGVWQVAAAMAPSRYGTNWAGQIADAARASGLRAVDLESVRAPRPLRRAPGPVIDAPGVVALLEAGLLTPHPIGVELTLPAPRWPSCRRCPRADHRSCDGELRT